MERKLVKSELETLLNLGVTTDDRGRLCIQDGAESGIRRLTMKEREKAAAAAKGYQNPNLPERIKAGSEYSPIEKFHLAAAASKGVPDAISQPGNLLSTLERQLNDAGTITGLDGIAEVPYSVAFGYFVECAMLAGKGRALKTPEQFIDGLIAHVESTLSTLEKSATSYVDLAKSMISNDSYDHALKIAIEAAYVQDFVVSLMPKLKAVKERRERSSPAAMQYLKERATKATAPATQ